MTVQIWRLFILSYVVLEVLENSFSDENEL